MTVDQAIKHVVLASSSPYRRELLARFRVKFEVLAPDIDEKQLPHEQPIEMARRLSENKAAAIASKRTNSLVIASDQVADCDGVIVSKPMTIAAATAQLRRHSDKWVKFHTGIALLNTESGHLQLDVVTCAVKFRALDEDQIARYIALDKPLDCAGSFRSEGLGACLVEQMQCPDPAALQGLPLIRLAGMLRNEGMQLP